MKWENGKPVPLYNQVKMSGPQNKIVDGKFDDAHYVMRHSSQLFNMTSNLIPFLGNTSGGRAGMASDGPRGGPGNASLREQRQRRPRDRRGFRRPRSAGSHGVP